MNKIRTIMGATLAAAALAAAPAAAQTAGRGATLNVQGGGLMYDREDDGTFGMGAVRVDWLLNRYVRAEVGGSFSRPKTTMFRETNGNTETYEANINLATATVGVQAQLPTRFASPYVGIATGLFARFDPAGGDRFFRPTQEVMAGLRVPVSERIGVRGELRYRLDQHQDGGTSNNVEQTLGVTIRM